MPAAGRATVGHVLRSRCAAYFILFDLDPPFKQWFGVVPCALCARVRGVGLPIPTEVARYAIGVVKIVIFLKSSFLFVVELVE